MNGSQNNMTIGLYESPKTVFTIRGIGMMIGESREGVLSKRLNYHVRKGTLLNPRRGIYAKKGYNPEELACLLYTPSYLSLEYVLQKAGVVFQYDSRLTSVSYLSRMVEMDGHEYCYRRIKGEILTNTMGIDCGNGVSIASKERAFLDVIYLNTTYYFDNLRPLDYRRVKQLLPIYGNKRMEQRVKKMFEGK